MGNIKIDTETFRLISAFSRLTKVQPKDCIVSEDAIYFLVEPDEVGAAIGKSGDTVKRASRVLGKQVKIFEYSPDPATLLKNLIQGAENVEVVGDSIKFILPAKEKYSVIGRGGRNINVIREFMQRHCNINNLKFR